MTSSTRVTHTRSGSSVPVFRQAGHSDCGLACIAMVAYAHGIGPGEIQVPLEVARSKHDNLSALDLVVIASANGLPAVVAGVPIRQVDMVPLPAILHWDGNHFVVLADCRNGEYVIHDPSVGIRVTTFAELGKHYSGVLVHILRGGNVHGQ